MLLTHTLEVDALCLLKEITSVCPLIIYINGLVGYPQVVQMIAKERTCSLEAS